MVVPMATCREQVMQLIQQRDKLEQKINDYGVILKTNNIGMSEPLVDPEGYPRNDIDVYQVRHARHQIICLQNDFKALTKQIEIGLQTFHAEVGNQSQEYLASTKQQAMEVDNVTTAISNAQLESAVEKKAIAKANFVAVGSPAEEAGIQTNDEIIQFGTVHEGNFTDVSQIATIVRNSQNRAVVVKVRRVNGSTATLSLTPKTWPGRGLLGCNIVPC